ncbi:MAG: insulinase family protein, partial [Rickettsiales bacterium]|nr:insulinase family protein [Rickettsiales bacterium]
MIFNPTLHTLSNGIVVILDPMDIATTSVDVSFGVGARDENPDQYGITHFIEHILMKGTARFPSSLAIDEHLEDFGGTYNASTGNNNMRAYGRILSENINVLIDLLGDLVQNSLFDEKVLDNERRVIADELRRSLDNPDRCMYYFSAENIFAGSGMAHNTLGTFDTIANMSRDEMIGFMKSHISSKNTIITVGGKIEDADKIIALLEKTFGWIPTFDVPVNDAATVFTTVAHNPKPEQNQVKLRLFF